MRARVSARTLRDTAIRALASGGAVAAWNWNKEVRFIDDGGHRHEKSRDNKRKWSSKHCGSYSARGISFLSPAVTLTEASMSISSTTPPSTMATRRSTKPAGKMYDFVVIGYSNAGKGAVETLQKECPNASIALIDPLRRPTDCNQSKLEYFPKRVIGLTPKDHTVELDDCLIQYRHAVLVATGAHGAPPPSYLMDEKAHSRIFELRPTILPADSQRPVLSTDDVRTKVLQSASAGAAIGVLGCGWDAIDLVVQAAASSKTKTRHTLIFGSHGPMGHVLPNYLSSAVAKRLKTKRIDVLDRSLIRYVSYDDHTKDLKKTQQQQQHNLQVYTAKSFDYLDGRTTAVDLLVVAPEVNGSRGSGTLPTDEVPEFLEETAKGRCWYQTWSNLSVMSPDDPSFITCYKDDGRIAVNSELCACTGVYAAGSVAKCANAVTGNCVVAGVGVEDGRAAGRVAGMNMARHYNHSITGSSSLFSFGSNQGAVPTFAKDPIPVWRSDLGAFGSTPTSLSGVGVIALCVGNCDSETLNTHGVWWTNQSAQRRLMLLMGNDDDNDDYSTINKKNQERRRIRKALKPVYGLGVVFYLDRTGKVQGVMTWGLPFTSHRGHELNAQLVEQMKNVIKTNGGFRTLETELDHIRMSKYLGDESRKMVALAFASNMGDVGKSYQVDGALESFPRPLHRYTEVRPPNVRSVGVLKRKDGHGFGILGEDLFARYEDDSIADAPPPRPHPTGNVGFAVNKVEARYEWAVWDQKERRWDENEARARPPKEEPLWIRKGDETRNIPQRERIAAAYRSVIG